MILDFYDNTIQQYISSYFEDAVMAILVTEENEMKLIEFNPILTSEGGLFSWIDDRGLLNGEKKDGAVMRIVEPTDA